METFLSDFVVSVFFFLQTLVAIVCGVAIARVYIMLGSEWKPNYMSALYCFVVNNIL